MTQRVQGKEILRAVTAQAQRKVRQKPSRRVLWSEIGVQGPVEWQFCAAGSQSTSLGFAVSGIVLVLVLQSRPEKWI